MKNTEDKPYDIELAPEDLKVILEGRMLVNSLMGTEIRIKLMHTVMTATNERYSQQAIEANLKKNLGV